MICEAKNTSRNKILQTILSLYKICALILFLASTNNISASQNFPEKFLYAN